MDRCDLLPPGPGWELTPAEQRLVECAASGEVWRPQVSKEKKWDRDPAQSKVMARRMQIRPEVIRSLMIGARWSKCRDHRLVRPKGRLIVNANKEAEHWPVHPKGLRMRAPELTVISTFGAANCSRRCHFGRVRSMTRLSWRLGKDIRAGLFRFTCFFN